MRIIPLGVGGAFTDQFYHSNYLIELAGFRLLIDAGATLRYSLLAAGYTAKDIHAVTLTHFHSDHAGGLEEFAQRCRYLYQYRPTILAMADQLPLLDRLFSLHGAKTADYFNVTSGKSPLDFTDAAGTVYQLEYYATTGLHAEVTSNYMIGIRRMGSEPLRVLFTGDLGPIEKSVLGQLVADPRTAAVFHDCHTGAAPVPAHPSLAQIEQLYPPQLRSKIVLTHYGDNIDEQADHIQKLGFRLARQGQVYKW